jgi:hypothetical protein
LTDVGKRVVLNVGVKKDMCAHKEQYLGAGQQNIARYLSFLWGKSISWHCVGDILSRQKV